MVILIHVPTAADNMIQIQIETAPFSLTTADMGSFNDLPTAFIIRTPSMTITGSMPTVRINPNECAKSPLTKLIYKEKEVWQCEQTLKLRNMFPI